MWEYYPLVNATRVALIEDIGTYISGPHNILEQYIATRPIMDLILDT